MIQYYLWLGLKSLKCNPWLTSLMVLTLAVGVASSVATLTILRAMSGDPIPTKSNRLLVPLIDNSPAEGYVAGTKQSHEHLTYKDSVAFLASNQGVARTAIYPINGALEQQKRDSPTLSTYGFATTTHFFTMFNVPFLHGAAWRVEDENAQAKVVVLSKSMSEKLFANTNPVGQTLTFRGQIFTVSGVIGAWNPQPAFVNVFNGGSNNFSNEEEIFIPFQTAVSMEISTAGSTNCSSASAPGYQGRLASECVWIQFWFETATSDDRANLLQYLRGYTAEQRKLGRFLRNNVDQLFDVNEWLVYRGVVDDDRKLSVWISFGFLVLCLVNTIGLLLAKFAGQAPQVGVRRALGASQSNVFAQYLIETAVLGLVGGALGLALSFAGLWLISQQSAEIAAVASLNVTMMLATFSMAVGAALIAGVFPAWRAAQASPARELKSQ